MNKICTSLEQSKRLIELGIDIDTADLTVTNLPLKGGERFDFICMRLPSDTFPSITDGKSEKIPAWSLNALLELMPDKIQVDNENYYLNLYKTRVEYRGPMTYDGQKCITFGGTNLIDAIFEAICWLKIKNKL